MTADTPAVPTFRLHEIALAAIEAVCEPAHHGGTGHERDILRHTAALVRANGQTILEALEQCARAPRPDDQPLVSLARHLRLSRVELLAVAIAASVEDDALVGRVLAHVQAPIGGSRPTVGLVAAALGTVGGDARSIVPALLNGAAARTGLLLILNEGAPIPERPLAVPAPLCLALAGHDSEWPATVIGADVAALVALPEAIRSAAVRHAVALVSGTGRALALRTGSPAEGRSVATAIAEALTKRAAFIETDKVAGFGSWLRLRDLVPVFCMELAPGDRRRLPGLPGYDGPILVVCGPDGSIEMPHSSVASWSLPIPSRDERRTLWMAALEYDANGEGRMTNGHPSLAAAADSAALADDLAAEHRHGSGRIAHLGRLAQHYAALGGRAGVERADVLAAAWTGEGGGLDSLAEPLRTTVSDEALVAAPALRDDLDALVLRCRSREDLAAGLGVSTSTRYRPGVRALFTGPSGTGKTLGAAWIATQLGLPLYRVDLASVTSKYIGETEKNLSQLLARAEQADVILLFDEADSLFGKRTDIADATDRFANAQTNYLLQRIENYDGLVLLTSNSQARFDDAFARRIDFIIDFPAPGPAERRALWQSHLGPGSSVTPSELNQLAVLVDLNGGQTRNVVLAAAVHARHQRRDIQFADLLAGIGAELRKTGRQLPIELAART
jgi:hypothetical protein